MVQRARSVRVAVELAEAEDTMLKVTENLRHPPFVDEDAHLGGVRNSNRVGQVALVTPANDLGNVPMLNLDVFYGDFLLLFLRLLAQNS